MVNKKVIEVLYGGFKNSTQAQKFLQQAGNKLQKGKKETNKFINSIFTEGLRGTLDGTKKFLPIAGLSLVAGQPVNAKDNNYSNLHRKSLEFFNQLALAPAQVANKTIENPDILIDALVSFLPVGLAMKAPQIATKALNVFKDKGAKVAAKYITDIAGKFRQQVVKKLPTVTEKVKQGSTLLKGSIDDAISKSKTFRASGKTVEEVKLAKRIVENGKKLKQLSDELGIKSAKEIPNLLKFVDQLGSIIRNSPKYVIAKAKGSNGILGAIGNVGLSTYDLWQAFKENDDSLIPKTVANTARIGTSLIPGNSLLKLLYGGLGYVAGDNLTKAALNKLGIKRNTTSEQEKEYETGMAYPDLESYVPEYLTGVSGRKYHVVGEKIYDFSTGNPVNVNEALTDADNYLTMQTQKNNDMLANVNNQIAEMEKLEQRGYNIPPETKAQLYQEKDSLLAAVQNNQQSYLGSLNEYDADGDLVEQYRQKYVVPQEIEQQQIQQQNQQNYINAYQEMFNKIANDTFNDLDNYYTPENQAIEYYQYMTGVPSGSVPYLSPEEFSRIQKVKAMQQIAPVMREKALSQLNSIIATQQSSDKDIRDYNLDVREQIATEKQNYIDNLINAYEAEERARHNRVGEQIDTYEAETGRQNAQSSSMNAITNRMEIPIKQGQLQINQDEYKRKQNLLPYQQASYASEAVMNAGMSGLTMDQFLNSNQSVMSQVFPGTQQGNNQQQQYKNFNLGQ
jgi:hypothetical protein